MQFYDKDELFGMEIEYLYDAQVYMSYIDLIHAIEYMTILSLQSPTLWSKQNHSQEWKMEMARIIDNVFNHYIVNDHMKFVKSAEFDA